MKTLRIFRDGASSKPMTESADMKWGDSVIEFEFGKQTGSSPSRESKVCQGGTMNNNFIFLIIFCILHFRVKMLMREDVKAARILIQEASAQILRRMAGAITAVPEVMAVTAS